MVGCEFWKALAETISIYLKSNCMKALMNFLFHLKRKPQERATAFASRFKAALARLENLISAESEASHAKRRRKHEPGRRKLGPASPVASSLCSLEDSSAPEADGRSCSEVSTCSTCSTSEVLRRLSHWARHAEVHVLQGFTWIEQALFRHTSGRFGKAAA